VLDERCCGSRPLGPDHPVGRTVLDGLSCVGQNAEYILSHNILSHDIPQLKAIASNLAVLPKPAIDTLHFSPLVYPVNLHRWLVRNYQLVQNSVIWVIRSFPLVKITYIIDIAGVRLSHIRCVHIDLEIKGLKRKFGKNGGECAESVLFAICPILL